MQIATAENVIYILLSGLKVSLDIALDENITLLSADTSKLNLETAIAACSRPDDISVITAFIPRITSQFKITATTPKELAILAWNSTWDALLLSSIFHTEVGFNIQSDTEASLISDQTKLCATNFHFHGFQATPYKLNADDVIWIKDNFSEARLLLDDERFKTAVHCLASYRWHSMPRIRMAVLWAGIEGIFGASSEIRFRISLYIARFLHPTDAISRKEKFEVIKKLYNSRSSAVHGSRVKDNLAQAVKESAEVLREIILMVIEQRELPNEDKLVP